MMRHPVDPNANGYWQAFVDDGFGVAITATTAKTTARRKFCGGLFGDRSNRTPVELFLAAVAGIKYL